MSENADPNRTGDCTECGHFCEHAGGAKASKPRWGFAGGVPKPRCCLCRGENTKGDGDVDEECGSCIERRNFAEMGYDDSKNSLLASPSPAPSPASRASPFTLISPNLARMGFTRGEALIEEDEEESLPPTASNSINVGDNDQRPPSTSGQAAASRNSQSARKAKDLKEPLMEKGNQIDHGEENAGDEPPCCRCSIQ